MTRAMFVLLATLGFSTRAPSAAGDDWPNFRGPLRNGSAPKATVPTDWDDAKNVAWKTPIPGAGWSQPIVVDGLAFLTTAVAAEPMRPKNFAAGVRDPRSMPFSGAKAPNIEVEWRVVAVDLQSGRIRWSSTAAKGKPKYPIHPSNTYATETPVADDRRVYAYFGATGTVAAFDRDGRLQWKVELGAFPILEGFGTGSSLAILDDGIFVQNFNESTAFAVCLDAATGKERWRVERPQAGSSWSTPLVWKSRKRTDVVLSGQKLLTGHDPLTGKELWRAAGVNMPGSASIACDSERIYLGYRSPFSAGPLYALTAGATGDCSPPKGKTAFSNQAWALPGSAPGMPTPLVVAGNVYSLNDSVVTCVDAANGKQLFKQRLPGLKSIAASPVAAGNRAVFLDDAGNAVVLEVGPSFKQLGKGKIGDTFWSSPALSGANLLLRGVDHLYCIRSPHAARGIQ